MSKQGTQQSRSDVQKEAEILIRDLLSKQLGIDLAPRRLQVDRVGAVGTAYVDVDGVAPDESVLVEIFARQGVLKSGQRHKVQGDVLKLATLARSRPESRLIIAFCDRQAADGVVGWLAAAFEAWGIERRVVELPEVDRQRLRSAQREQNMVNALLDDSGDV